YDDRLIRLAIRGIALWDVVGEAHRQGSLDGAIRNPSMNQLIEFVATHPRLKAVAFNGKTAARLGRMALAGLDVQLIDLPSSSPAYTLAGDLKAERWAVLGALASPAEDATLGA